MTPTQRKAIESAIKTLEFAAYVSNRSGLMDRCERSAAALSAALADENALTPRDVIAKAISDAYETRHLKTDIWLETADAVIDALASMEVTDLMHARVEWWMASDETVAELWRAMVGAMRDE